MQYRAEIDGLRAVAIIPVILFHAGFNLFSGGYIGVDVFFVISGYLITSNILQEKDRDNFSLIAFYDRRIRRIMPALILVVLSCIPVSIFIFLPHELKDFSQSLIAIATFSTNILFWQESDYFASSAEFKPLLHTWSLAVEEQYYILFPLFIMMMWRFGKNRIAVTLSILLIVSLGLGHWGSVYKSGQGAFYLLPMRGWEILLGALAAFYLHEKGHAQTSGLRSNVLSLLGIFFIFVAIFSYSELTPVPSLYTLLPTVGTLFVILFSNAGTLSAKILSHRILVGIGLISYSAYLWHQPIFSFVKYKSLAEPSITFMLFLCAVTLLLAYISWRFVEKPFRVKDKFSRKYIYQFALVMSAFIGSLGLLGNQLEGSILPLSNNQKKIIEYRDYPYREHFRADTCFLSLDQSFNNFVSDCTPEGTDAVVWGDSHAAALSYGLRAFEPQMAQLTTSACPPILGENFQTNLKCKEINENVYSRIREIKPNKLYLHANWSDYKNSLHFLKNTVKSLAKNLPNTQVIVIGGVPQWAPDLPTLLVRKNVSLVEDATPLYVSTDNTRVKDADVIISLISGSEGVSFLSILQKVCVDNNCVGALGDGGLVPISWDAGHLTKEGSLYIAKQLLR